ncbi:hypothetical protein B0O80DRAFT_238974 [Mortierella sp. GBAus27b]|nr:hypothetical protein B0O80DRAFT_238974 [Mortierella sp. GBAus27b]
MGAIQRRFVVPHFVCRNPRSRVPLASFALPSSIPCFLCFLLLLTLAYSLIFWLIVQAKSQSLNSGTSFSCSRSGLHTRAIPIYKIQRETGGELSLLSSLKKPFFQPALFSFTTQLAHDAANQSNSTKKLVDHGFLRSPVIMDLAVVMTRSIGVFSFQAQCSFPLPLPSPPSPLPYLSSSSSSPHPHFAIFHPSPMSKPGWTGTGWAFRGSL